MPPSAPGTAAGVWHPIGGRGGDLRVQLPRGGVVLDTSVAFVCGDPVVWKPSEPLPCARGLRRPHAPPIAEWAQPTHPTPPRGPRRRQRACGAPQVALLSDTAPPGWGREVGPRWGPVRPLAARTRGTTPSWWRLSENLDLAVSSIVFAGPARPGQRCTAMRRLIVLDRADELVGRLEKRSPAPRGRPLRGRAPRGANSQRRAFTACRWPWRPCASRAV
jgi:aldehyde dehydrogenase (NAD+)